MLHFISKFFNWARKVLPKNRRKHLIVIGLVVFSLFTSLIYASPISDSARDTTTETSSSTGSTRKLFSSRSTSNKPFDFIITDPTGLSSDPETALSNQFKYANDEDFSRLAPGDKLDFSYEISNTGREAIEVRETYYILTFVPQSTVELDFAMFGDFKRAEHRGSYMGVSSLTANNLDGAGRLYSFTSEPYTLRGSDDSIFSAPRTKKCERYMVFNRYSGNKMQGEKIVVVVTLGFKANDGSEWESSITETVIGGGYTTSTEYRTDTDVYLSCDIAALDYINPENPGYVKFTVTDEAGNETILTYDDFNSPVIGVQRAYVPFHIPDVPGELTVSITSSDNVVCDTDKIIATVVSSEENAPPDPTLGTVVPLPGPLPIFKESNSHEWVTYTATKNSLGEWEYEEQTHTASLNINFTLTPDSNVETAVGNTMASGYGVNTLIESEISTVEAIYDIQNVYCFFPEFDYKEYSRKLEILSQDGTTTTWTGRENEYSHSQSRVHYIPPAYPDGLYTVFATVRDAWTPVGELKGSVTAEVNISGSLFDDWYIAQTD